MKRSTDKPLSSGAAQLVRAGRGVGPPGGSPLDGGGPTQADRDRNFDAISQRIAQGSLPDVSHVPDPSALPSTTVSYGTMGGWIVAATLGAGVLGGLYMLSGERDLAPTNGSASPSAPRVEKLEEAPREQGAKAPDATPSSTPTSSDMQARGQSAAAPGATPSEGQGASVPHSSASPASAPPSSVQPLPISSQPATEPSEPSDELAQEVALLSAATSALRAGRAQETLNLLHQHQERFPYGALSQERRSAQAQALCLLGNRPAAEAVLRTLSPSSPLTARAKRACNLE